MELTLNGVTVAIISLGVIILLAVVGGHMSLAFRVGKLPTREELHEVRNEAHQDIAALREDFRRDMAEMREGMRQEFRQEMATMRAEMRLEFRQDMAQMRLEFRQDMAEMREELRQEFRHEIAVLREDLLAAIRASEARIIKAIMDHRHPTPDAPPVFVEPV